MAEIRYYKDGINLPPSADWLAVGRNSDTDFEVMFSFASSKDVYSLGNHASLEAAVEQAQTEAARLHAEIICVFGVPAPSNC